MPYEMRTRFGGHFSDDNFRHSRNRNLSNPHFHARADVWCWSWSTCLFVVCAQSNGLNVSHGAEFTPQRALQHAQQSVSI